LFHRACLRKPTLRSYNSFGTTIRDGSYAVIPNCYTSVLVCLSHRNKIFPYEYPRTPDSQSKFHSSIGAPSSHFWTDSLGSITEFSIKPINWRCWRSAAVGDFCLKQDMLFDFRGAHEALAIFKAWNLFLLYMKTPYQTTRCGLQEASPAKDQLNGCGQAMKDGGRSHHTLSGLASTERALRRLPAMQRNLPTLSVGKATGAPRLQNLLVIWGKSP